MAVITASAHGDENGKAYGGQAGDQTKREISRENWYRHSKGWILLRAKSAEAREKIAQCMEWAADNEHIGYDQYQRNTLYNEAKQFGFDVRKVTKDVETDCSALIRVCCAYAGIMLGDYNTSNQVDVFRKSGQFEIYTDAAHCAYSDLLMRGDIEVTATKGHTIAILSDGANVAHKLGERTLMRGMAGSDVKELQKILSDDGYSLAPYGADGDFGSVTEKAVKEFQKDNKLEQTGIYDGKTHKALLGESVPDAPEEKPVEQTWAKTVVTTGSVNIRTGNGTQYIIVGSVGKGTSFEYVATAENKWVAVVYNGNVYWISGSYVTFK